MCSIETTFRRQLCSKLALSISVRGTSSLGHKRKIVLDISEEGRYPGCYIITCLCTSILPNVNEISATSTSSGDAAKASSNARISSIPWNFYFVNSPIDLRGEWAAYRIGIDDDLVLGHVGRSCRYLSVQLSNPSLDVRL